MAATVITDLVTELAVPVDGTLSRVLYRDDRLRVVGFAFAAGQELTEHTAAVPAVIQVVRGRLALSLGGRETVAEPGGWVHMPAKLPHSVRALEPSVMLLTMLPDTGRGRAGSVEPAAGARAVTDAPNGGIASPAGAHSTA